MAASKDYKRVQVVLVGIIFVILFLIVNSEQFRVDGFIFLAMATFAFSIYARGRLL